MLCRLLCFFFLPGSKELRPWGLCQKLPYIRSKVSDALHDSLRNYGKSEKNNSDNPNIPFLAPKLSKNLSVEERLLALEFFLKEYVVTVDKTIVKESKPLSGEIETEKSEEI